MFNNINVFQAVAIFLFPNEEHFTVLCFKGRMYSISLRDTDEMLSNHLQDKKIQTLRSRKSDLIMRGRDCSDRERVELSEVVVKLNREDYPNYVFKDTNS